MKYVIGIDEVGRGPVAGPIAVGALMMPAEKNVWDVWEGLKDSKKLTEKKREEWFHCVQTDFDLTYRVAMVGAKEIDEKGIARAATTAAARAIAELEVDPRDARVLADYGLKAPKEWQQEAFKKGDEREPVIALASIVAKVTRDTLMKKLAEEHPHYGLERHKGYGTKAHLEAIREHGQVPDIHRHTFIHLQGPQR